MTVKFFWFGVRQDRSPYSYSAYYSGSGTSLWPGLDSGRIARKEQPTTPVPSPRFGWPVRRIPASKLAGGRAGWGMVCVVERAQHARRVTDRPCGRLLSSPHALPLLPFSPSPLLSSVPSSCSHVRHARAHGATVLPPSPRPSGAIPITRLPHQMPSSPIPA